MPILDEILRRPQAGSQVNENLATGMKTGVAIGQQIAENEWRKLQVQQAKDELELKKAEKWSEFQTNLLSLPGDMRSKVMKAQGANLFQRLFKEPLDPTMVEVYSRSEPETVQKGLDRLNWLNERAKAGDMAARTELASELQWQKGGDPAKLSEGLNAWQAWDRAAMEAQSKSTVWGEKFKQILEKKKTIVESGIKPTNRGTVALGLSVTEQTADTIDKDLDADYARALRVKSKKGEAEARTKEKEMVQKEFVAPYLAVQNDFDKRYSDARVQAMNLADTLKGKMALGETGLRDFLVTGFLDTLRSLRQSVVRANDERGIQESGGFLKKLEMWAQKAETGKGIPKNIEVDALRFQKIVLRNLPRAKALELRPYVSNLVSNGVDVAPILSDDIKGFFKKEAAMKGRTALNEEARKGYSAYLKKMSERGFRQKALEAIEAKIGRKLSEADIQSLEPEPTE